jgi:mitogen-activated protein kinase kinase kinase
VYRAIDEDGMIFAVKEASVEDGNDADSKFRAKLEAELQICKSLRHRHIVSYLGHEYQEGQLLIYLEYVAGGSMEHVLREFGPLCTTLLRLATRGLLEGLNYLHTCDPPVVHRDIKSANVLVDLDFCVKLADFGCSKRDDITRSFTTAGSILWMAPEVLQQQPGHGRKADLWSLGCTLIEMATGERPWGSCAFDNFVAAVRCIGLSDATPPIGPGVDASARDLIERCVQRAPEERPWAGQLLGHDFVREAATSTTRVTTCDDTGVEVFEPCA